MKFDKIKSLFSEQSYATNKFSFEMRERRGALIGGVCGIVCSDSSCVILRLIGGERLKISGKRLDCDSNGNRFVEVSGNIELVEFHYEKNI